MNKRNAPGEDRTHDLQISDLLLIMRLTRCLLRYRGRDGGQFILPGCACVRLNQRTLHICQIKCMSMFCCHYHLRANALWRSNERS